MYVSTEGVERLIGILNRNKLLHDEWMEDLKGKSEQSLTTKLRKELRDKGWEV